MLIYMSPVFCERIRPQGKAAVAQYTGADSGACQFVFGILSGVPVQVNFADYIILVYMSLQILQTTKEVLKMCSQDQ